MKTIFPISALLFASIALAQTAASAQSTAPAKPHAAPTAKPAAPAAKPAAPSAAGCVKLPVLSPKIPALPPGSPCAKPLYTITFIANPGVKLSDLSPMEYPELAESLGTIPSTFTLSYIDTKIGTGALLAPRKWYTIQYTGYLVDGAIFDSSYDHPDHAAFTFQQGPAGPQGQRQTVTGMDTGLDGIKVGGKRRLFIPWQLGYGTADYPPPPRPTTIPGKSMLIFDIELISQSDTDPTPKTPPGAVNSGHGSGSSTPAPASSTTAPATAPAAAPAPAATAPQQPAAPKP